VQKIILYNRLAFRVTKRLETFYSKKGEIRFGKGKKLSIFAAAKNARSSNRKMG
jgi:hypothetical protein